MTRGFLAALTVASIALASCRTASDVSLQTRAAGSAQERVELLRSVRAGAPSLAAFSKIRVTSGGRVTTFSARIVSSRNGALLINVYSPLGTELATLFASGSSAVVFNHVEQTWWEGPLSTIAASSPIFTFLSNLTPADAGSILLGYVSPRATATCEASDGAACVTDGSARYVVTSDGLAAVGASGLRATYDPPADPPAHAVLELAGVTIDVRHNEIVQRRDEVSKPAVPPGYRCCVLPKLQ